MCECWMKDKKRNFMFFFGKILKKKKETAKFRFSFILWEEVTQKCVNFMLGIFCETIYGKVI